MKNKVPKSESVFQKKGFYIALYSCLGVVLVVAAAISFGNLGSGNLDTTKKDDLKAEANYGEMEAVSKSTVESYLTPSDKKQADNKVVEDGVKKAAEASAPTANTAKVELDEAKALEESAKTVEEPTKTVTSVTKADETATATPEKIVAQQPKEEVIQPVVVAEAEAEVIQPAAEEAVFVEQEEALVEPVFKSFTDTAQMVWPVFGEIVMDYSIDSVIYDKTLDQFRTNDNICIAAQVGTQVKASSEGVVKLISKDLEKGNQVVIDHGNGWETTYSQLQDNILVNEGDVVKADQVIGGVGNPTMYSVLLGDHLSFKVTKDDSIVNPKEILQK